MGFLPDDHGVQKINAAHAIGGSGMTIRTIEETLGVKIDRYIMVHDEAVKEIVDALGGVDIYVEKNMHYNDYSGKLFINLKKGPNHLSGKEVIGYLRFRHDPMGDIGRTQRQQWFLRGMMEALKKPETITKLPEIINVASKYIKTNMSFYELSQYAGFAKHLDMDKIEIAMLPGAPKKKGLIMANSVGVIDKDYYGNPDNDGHIMFAFYNIKEEDIEIKKGEAIGQALFQKYLITDDDKAEGKRMGGFGSTRI